jgi:hypothetical protein
MHSVSVTLNSSLHRTISRMWIVHPAQIRCNLFGTIPTPHSEGGSEMNAAERGVTYPVRDMFSDRMYSIQMIPPRADGRSYDWRLDSMEPDSYRPSHDNRDSTHDCTHTPTPQQTLVLTLVSTDIGLAFVAILWWLLFAVANWCVNCTVWFRRKYVLRCAVCRE